MPNLSVEGNAHFCIFYIQRYGDSVRQTHSKPSPAMGSAFLLPADLLLTQGKQGQTTRIGTAQENMGWG
ncbi:MAG: hypothetical protein MUF72_15990 [Elainella sp. Prado103]|nr:hypothetical protein [Elainella sp. Prado103]